MVRPKESGCLANLVCPGQRRRARPRPRRRAAPRRARPPAGHHHLRPLRRADDHRYHSATASATPARSAPPSPAHTLDERVGQLLIDTLTPLAAEAALQVSAELEQRAGQGRRAARRPRRARPLPHRLADEARNIGAGATPLTCTDEIFGTRKVQELAVAAAPCPAPLRTGSRPRHRPPGRLSGAGHRLSGRAGHAGPRKPSPLRHPARRPRTRKGGSPHRWQNKNQP
jgi:hypothetical protein